jgi:hypothetical protein
MRISVTVQSLPPDRMLEEAITQTVIKEATITRLDREVQRIYRWERSRVYTLEKLRREEDERSLSDTPTSAP